MAEPWPPPIDPAPIDPAPVPPVAALEAVGLGRRHRRGWALRECGVRIPAGRICALVGPNGAGKSTFLSLAGGLLAPTEGRARIFGLDARSAAARARTALLGQDKPLYRGFTVTETLRTGLELNPTWSRETAERIVDEGRIPLKAKISSLSGGQRTRVALAVAFAKQPDLLMLDEPMADLDPLVRHEVTELLRAEAAARGTTVILSSHTITELAALCDHTVVIAAGTVRLAGAVDELLAAHHLTPDEHVAPRTAGTSRSAPAPTLDQLLLGYLRGDPAAPHLAPDSRPDARPETRRAAA
ncbi:ABC transporter ATP-binding protein (plasmid) [Streptomyces sp. BI20]|uniref:ABC transporter ATP-binding protein n=1 Tax=Streptomyces sp. BI20 TaxID=3403460 RepID=UPI003C74308A